nr:biogenesis of lysosome-related organelles complex 1 subunit 5-like isoform X2 [Lepeophtheirus salmonis]
MSVAKDIFDIHDRLFNHRPFLQGEIRHFIKEFEEKREDREVHNLFNVLEKVTELRESEIDKIITQCDGIFPNLSANLLVAQSMSNKILDQGRTREIEQALENSKDTREKEWTSFMSEIQDTCAKIDDAYKRKEEDITTQYSKLEESIEKKN